MKKIPTLIAALLISVNLIAQVPQKLSYQAVIRNSANILIANQLVGMQISILQGSAAGTPVYVENHSPTTDINGLVTIEIGGGTPTIGSFSTINWASGSYFVKTETDPNGGSNYSITGTSQLLSVPYALYAANSGTSTGGGNFAHYIGESYGGGIIFHLWKDQSGVEQGLIVDLVDLSAGNFWSDVVANFPNGGASSTWDGLNNSYDIVNQPGHTASAADLCLNSNNGGFNDWYLPAIHELSILWENYYTVTRALTLTPGGAPMSPWTYWSSTSIGISAAWTQSFYDGTILNGNSKVQQFYVRAIRAF